MANETVFRRYEGNPIIVPSQVPRANSIFNSAVIPYGHGYVGVFRVDEICRSMTLHVGWSKDGMKWDISKIDSCRMSPVRSSSSVRRNTYSCRRTLAASAR